MFLDELSPIFKELIQQPVAFIGGLCSGVLRLSLSEDPLQSWLEQQKSSHSSYAASTYTSDNGRSSGPQSISID